MTPHPLLWTQSRTALHSVESGVLIARPHSLDVYDLENYKHRMSIPVHSDQVAYAVSERGELAVVEGDSLRVFAAEK